MATTDPPKKWPGLPGGETTEVKTEPKKPTSGKWPGLPSEETPLPDSFTSAPPSPQGGGQGLSEPSATQPVQQPVPSGMGGGKEWQVESVPRILLERGYSQQKWSDLDDWDRENIFSFYAGMQPSTGMGGQQPKPSDLYSTTLTGGITAPQAPSLQRSVGVETLAPPTTQKPTYALPTEQEVQAIDTERGVTSAAIPQTQKFTASDISEAALGTERKEAMYAKRLKDVFGMEPQADKPSKDTYRELTAYYDDQVAGLDAQGLEQFKAQTEQSIQGVKGMASAWKQEADALEQAARNFEQQVSTLPPEEANAQIQAFNAEAQRQASILDDKRKTIESLEFAMVRDLQMAALRDHDIKKETGSGLGVAALVGPTGVGRMTSGLTSFIIDGMTALMPAEFVGPEVASGEKTRDQAAKEIKRMMLDDIRKGGAEMTRRALGLDTTEEYYQDAAANGPFMAKAMIGLGESVPAMASPYMTGIFFQTADAIGQELEGKDFDDVSEIEKAGLKAAFGLPAMMLERLGFRNLAKNTAVTKAILTKVLGVLPTNATAGQIQRIVDAETRSYLANFGLRMGGAVAAEAETGGTQTTVDIATREIYNALKGKNILATPETLVDAAYQIGEGAALEAAGAGAMGAPVAISAAVRTGKVTKEMTDRQYEMLEGLLSDEDYAETVAKYHDELVKTGKMTAEQKSKVEEDLRVATDLTSQIPTDLPTDKRKEAFDLLLEKQALSGKDKNLVKGKIIAIDEKLAALADVKEEAAPAQATPKQEADTRRDVVTAREALKGTPDPKPVEVEWSGKDVTPKEGSEITQTRVDAKGRETTATPVVSTKMDGTEVVRFDTKREGKELTASGWTYNSLDDFLAAHPEVSDEVDIDQLRESDKDLGITRIVVTEHRFDPETGKGGVSVNIITESGSMEQKLRARGLSPWSKQSPKPQTSPEAQPPTPAAPVVEETVVEEAPVVKSDGEIQPEPKQDGEVVLNTLNPTGSVFSNYSAKEIDSLPLGENITTYDKTANINPDQKITVYRGVPDNVEGMVSGDFVTTNKQLAKDYAGGGKVISAEVRADEILDDTTEPLGEEYILRRRLQPTPAASLTPIPNKPTPTGVTPEPEVAPVAAPQGVAAEGVGEEMGVKRTAKKTAGIPTIYNVDPYSQRSEVVDKAASDREAELKKEHQRILDSGNFNKQKGRISEIIKEGEEAAKKAYVVDVVVDNKRNILGASSGASGKIMFNAPGNGYFTNSLVIPLFFNVENGKYQPNELAKSLGIKTTGDSSFSISIDSDNAAKSAQILKDNGFNVRIVDNVSKDQNKAATPPTPAPGQGGKTEADPYTTKNGKFSVYQDKDGNIIATETETAKFKFSGIKNQLKAAGLKEGDPLKNAKKKAKDRAEQEFANKFGIERKKEEMEKDRRKRIYKLANNADPLALGEYGRALFAMLGEKLDPKSIRRELGGTRVSGTTSEADAAIKLFGKEGGQSVEKLAEYLAIGEDGLGEGIHDPQDLRDAIIQVLGKKFNNIGEVYTALENHIKDTGADIDAETRLQQEYYDEVERRRKAEGLSDENIDAAETQADNIPKSEVDDVFGSAVGEDPFETKATLQDESTKQPEVRQEQPKAPGDIRGVSRQADAVSQAEEEFDAEYRRLGKEVDKAFADLNAAIKDFNDRGQTLFEETEGSRAKAIESERQASKEDFDRITKPLKAKYEAAKKARQEFRDGMDAWVDKRAKEIESQGDLFGGTDPDLDDLLGVKRQDPLKQEAGPDNTTKSRMTNEKAIKLLKLIAPGLKIITHKDQPSLSKAYAKSAGRNTQKSETATTKGFYVDAARKEIHIGPFASQTTLAHEVMHPLFRAAFAENPEAVKRLYNELLKDPDFAPYIEHGNKPSYKAVGEERVMEEAIVQFMAGVYEGKLDAKFKADRNFLQKVRDFIKDMMAKLGLRKSEVNFSNIENLKQMAGLINEAMRTGATAVTDKAGVKAADIAMQEDANRLVDGWYSRLDDAVAGKGNTQSGADWMKWAEARAKEGMLSMEEVKWTGLADFLQGKAKVTPQEVRAFLKDNRVKVEVKVLGDKVSDGVVAKWWNDQYAEKYPNLEWSKLNERQQDQARIDYAGETDQRENRTKFSQYQLPGGTNYREVLVTLPKIDSYAASQAKVDAIREKMQGILDMPDTMQLFDKSRKGDEAAKAEYDRRTEEYKRLRDQRDELVRKAQSGETGEVFKTGHFPDQDNILFHLRLNDRTDADGKKVLFIEEIQSDWAQKGRKEGFADGDAWRIEAELDALIAEYNKLEGVKVSKDITGTDVHFMFTEVLDMPDGTTQNGKVTDTNVLLRQIGGKAKEQAAIIQAKAEELRKARQGTPSAPFVTDTSAWVELAIKQAVRMAVEGGYDRVAWTKAQHHTDRWGTERIEWAKQPDGGFLVNAKAQHGGNAGGVDLEGEANAQNLNPQNSKAVSSREQLEDTIRPSLTEGQDAKKLSEKLWQRMQAEESGVSMPRKEGFEGFYDKIVPTIAAKVIKKMGGGKVGETDLGITAGEKSQFGDGPFSAQDAVVKKRAEGVFQVWVNGKIRGGNHASEAAAMEYIKSMAPGQTQPSFDITPDIRAKVGMGVPLMAQGTPKEIAEAFKKKGYTEKTAREYMENAGVDEKTIGEVIGVFNTLMQKQVKQATGQRTMPIQPEDAKTLKDKVRLAAQSVMKGYRSGVAVGTEAGKAEGERAGRRATASEMRAARLEFIKAVTDALSPLEEQLTTAKTKTAIRRAATVDPSNPKQVEGFVTWLEDVVAKANERLYDSEVEKALDLSNPKKFKDRRPSGVVKGKIDNEIRKELEMIHEAIKRGSLNDVLGRIGEISTELSQNPERAADLEMELEAMRVAAEVLSGDNDRVRAAQQAIREIIQDGRSTLREELKEKAEKYQALREMATDAITGGKGVLTQFDRASAREKSRGLVQRMMDGTHGWLDSAEGLRTLMDKIDRGVRSMKDGYGGVMDVIVYKPVARSREKNTVANKDDLATMREKLSEIYGGPSKLKKALNENSRVKEVGSFVDLSGEQKTMRLSQNQAYYLYNLAKNPDNIPTFRAMGWTDEMLGAVETYLTPEVKQWADWQTKVYYRDKYKDVNKVYKKMNYIDLPMVDNYTPIRREALSGQPGEIDVDIRDGAKGAVQMMGIAPSALKERTKSTANFDVTVDGDAVLLSHASKMNHYIAFAETIKDLSVIFGNTTVREAIRQNNNDMTLKVIDGFVTDIAREGATRDKSFSVMDKMRGAMATSTLAISPVITIKQLTSFPAYAADIPIKEFVRGLGAFAANPIRANRILMQSEYMQERYKSGFDRDMAVAMARDYKKTFTGGSTLFDKMMFNVRWGDKGAVLMGGYAVYDYHYRMALKEGKSETAANKIAIQQFEEATKMSQQSTNIEDLSHFQRGDGAMRLFTLYQTSPFAYFRQERKSIRDFIRGSRQGDTALMANATKRFLVYHFVLPTIFQYVANGLPGLLSDWDDEDERDMIRAASIGSLNGVFMFGTLLGYVADKFTDKPWAKKGFKATPVFDQVTNLSDQLVKAWKLWEKNPQQFQEDIFEVLADVGSAGADFSGLPATRVRKMFDNYRKIVEMNDDLDPGQIALLALGYSQYAAGLSSKKRRGPAGGPPGGPGGGPPGRP